MEISQELDQALIIFHVFQPDLLQSLDLHLTVNAKNHLCIAHAPLRGDQACDWCALLGAIFIFEFRVLPITRQVALISALKFLNLIINIVEQYCGLACLLTSDNHFHFLLF